MTRERLLQIRDEARAMQYLKKHDVNIQKVYNDVYFNRIIADIETELLLMEQPFQKLSDKEFLQVQNLFR